ncbi:hypothetical protein PILCRDRAFT_819379 [Piloderma croceum F 1598]|uniref:Uncharacterized protein n=1 Tax=Piloderma croceum (strain F 1598) TaxID=765440 RepID=A0A0C3FW28_PILCF|nr:hypothetical protein PILCRDRAFT_819379 [Piloderma croceum F 1598]
MNSQLSRWMVPCMSARKRPEEDGASIDVSDVFLNIYRGFARSCASLTSTGSKKEICLNAFLPHC